jgi:hypothetical protein
MGENPSNHVFVDLDRERQGDLLRDSRTTPVGITQLHFDDRTDEFCARSFRAGLPSAIRGEQHAVLSLARGFVKARSVAGFSTTAERTRRVGRTKSAIQPERM